MTDAAPIADSAPVPVSEGAPISEPTLAPQPLGSQVPPDAVAKPEPAKPASLDDSIDRAIAKSAEKEAAKAAPVEKAPAKEPAKEAPARADDGKFAAKQPAEGEAKPIEAAKPVEAAKPPSQFKEPPRRFSEDAKRDWESAPEPVKAEIHRAVRELEEGLGKYREVVEPLKPFLQLAQQHNTTIDKALNQYINLEKSLRSVDPAQKQAALADVFQVAGIDPREWAGRILNQTPEQIAGDQNATIKELRRELMDLKSQVGNVTTNIQQQRESATLQEVNKFAQENPRFEELADAIAEELAHGYPLPEAYKRADRLNPAPASIPASVPPLAASAAPAIAPEAQNLKGQKSITGAPSPGLRSPGKPRAALSLDDALDRAFGSVG